MREELVAKDEIIKSTKLTKPYFHMIKRVITGQFEGTEEYLGLDDNTKIKMLCDEALARATKEKEG